MQILNKEDVERAKSGNENVQELIDTEKMKAPSFLMVLTAVGEHAYRRTDGVIVVPIGCLKD